jgi:hypothetical protein
MSRELDATRGLTGASVLDPAATSKALREVAAVSKRRYFFSLMYSRLNSCFFTGLRWSIKRTPFR